MRVTHVSISPPRIIDTADLVQKGERPRKLYALTKSRFGCLTNHGRPL